MDDLYITPNYLEPELILEYNIQSDIITVYEAWTTIEIFQKWFCPNGFTIALAEMNLKPGGVFRIHMKSPDGVIYPTKGEYILLEKPNRIVYKDSWDDNRQDNNPITTEVTFQEKDGKIKIQLYSSFVSTKQRDSILNSGVVDGWKMFLENLNRVVNS